MEKLDLSEKNLHTFGTRTMPLGLLGLALLVLILRHKNIFIPAIGIAGSFFIVGQFAATALKPVYIGWMKLASILAWINMHLILGILFYLVFTPFGLVMRLFGADLLDRKPQRQKKSYWIRTEEKVFEPKDYEHQF